MRLLIISSVLLFCLSGICLAANADIPPVITVFSNDNLTVKVQTDDLRQAYVYQAYKQNGAFPVKLFFIPQSQTSIDRMRQRAKDYAEESGYSSDQVSRIKLYALEGSFNLQRGKYYMEKVVYLDGEGYPVYGFSAIFTVNLNEDKLFSTVASGIVDFYNSIESN